jgi:ParB family transcriptional regulator, chromosome partitioning protein
MGRKNLLADLVTDKLTAVNSAEAAQISAEGPPTSGGSRLAPSTLGARGVVGAMSRSLEQISADRRALEARLAAGQNVLEIDAALIDASFVSDRMHTGSDDYTSLIESIRQYGQQVPVLVRPHPDRPGRYQIAFGHRRVRAAAELGRPIRAVVRQLTDDELIIAQGQENNEREDLSFIERASWAVALEDRSVMREITMAALSIDKTELSRLISVRRAIRNDIVVAIGRAPKVGRGRWTELAERLSTRGADKISADVLLDQRFQHAASDERFSMLFAALAPRRKRARPTIWADESGKKVARIERNDKRITLSLDETTAPAFGDFIIDRLPELYRAFRENRGDC